MIPTNLVFDSNSQKESFCLNETLRFIFCLKIKIMVCPRDLDRQN